MRLQPVKSINQCKAVILTIAFGGELKVETKEGEGTTFTINKSKK